MVNDIRDQILMNLEPEFNAEQLRLIDLAVANAIRGYRIEPEETLPVPHESAMPSEITEFLVRKKIKGLTTGTLKRYKTVLEFFSMWLSKDLKSTTEPDILAFLGFLMMTGISRHTVDNQRVILRSFYTFMHDSGRMASNPAKSIDPIKYPKYVRRPLDDIELELVRNACQTPRQKALFEVLYSTGCRVSEIIGMNCVDINWQERRLVVMGKGQKERYVYLNAKALVSLDAYLRSRKDNDPALFVAGKYPYHRLGKGSIEREIKAIGERSGIGRNIFPHLFRHTFASDLINHGAQINEVQLLLGHADISTTMIYAKTNREALARAHRQFLY